MRHLLLISCSIVIGGCATTEIVNQVPIPQLQASEVSQLKVCRQRIFYGDAAATIISLDRRPILRSSAGKCFSVKVAPGTHILSVMTQGPAGLDMREHEFTLQRGETKYFKTKFEQINETNANEFSDFSEYEQVIVQ